MLFKNKYHGYMEPLVDLQNKEVDLKAEMSMWQSAFLCDLLRNFRPKKLLEIGVAAGGTTTIVLNCLDRLNLITEMHSVDISEKYYQDHNLNTGYVANEYIKKYKPRVNHKFHLGNCSVTYMDEIGQNIDFLILDSAHLLPGELLDFLAWLPRLANGSVVVLHDLQLQHLTINSQKNIATNVLLSSVVGEKILEEEMDSVSKFPNIGAFIVNDDTRKYVQNVFIAMNLLWSYMPSTKELQSYMKVFQDFYNTECLRLFEMSILMNRHTMSMIVPRNKADSLKIKALVELSKKRSVYIYGCGKVAERVNAMLVDKGITINGFCVSENQTKPTIFKEKEVKYVSDIGIESVIVIGVGKTFKNEILDRLKSLNYDTNLIIEL